MNIMINKAKTAALDVDPQNGFTPLCPEQLPVPEGHQIAAALNAQAELATYRLLSKDSHPANAIWRANDTQPQFSPVEGDDVDIRWNMHCVPGTFGFDLIDGLPAVTDYNYVAFKGVETDLHPYGACYHDLGWNLSTGVIEFLRQNGVETVIVGGLALDYCVKVTALQLMDAGFQVFVNLDACRAIAAETAKAATKEMIDAGVTLIDTVDQLTITA